MSMEKRGVVNTDKEKTAHEQVKKDLLPEKKNQPPKPDQKVEEKK
ncbi:MAG TPA: hypothetical protein VLA34_05165 [Candidatus Krumholzibacterium sp.]|nr:hypothetical protein [Candidatus Krumholzibacterium sp.]